MVQVRFINDTTPIEVTSETQETEISVTSETQVKSIAVKSSKETDKHNELSNRDLPDQHPISAITGLQEALDTIPDDYVSDAELEAALLEKQDTLTAGTGISIENGVISNTQTSAEWGNIGGDITAQTDLQNALNLKANVADIPTKTSDLENDIGYITGITGSDVVSALGYTPYDSTNPDGYITSSALVGYATQNWVVNQNYITGDYIGDAVLTIQRNNTNIDTFTANAKVNKTINIEVPTTAAEVNALPDSTKYGYSIDLSLNTTDYKLTLTLKDQDGTILNSKTVDFPIESVVVNGTYDSINKKIVLTLQNGNTIDIPVGDLIAGLQTEITSENKLDADLVDDSTSTSKFVTSNEKNTWNSKQDTISDLATIRSGAALGATALQSGDNISELVNNSGYITSSYHDSTKQNTLIAGEDIEITENGLPNTYDRLSYIESTGIEYLIAPYKVNNKTKLYCRYKKLGNGGVSEGLISAVIGVTTYASPDQAYFGIFRGVPSGKNFNRVGWGDNTIGSVIDITGGDTVGTWYEIYFDLNNIYIDNTLVATSTTDPSTVWEAQYNLGIFARNSATVEKPFYGQISSVWAKEDDIYVLNLIPCKRKSDNVVGMYDTVSKTFLTNQNDTGAFVAGDIIPVSDDQVISFVNNAGYITSSALTPYVLSADLATVATSGSYNDLTDKPTIPTVNNPTITFTQGGTTKGTITLNQSTNETIELDAGGGGSDVEAFTAAEVQAIWEAN